LCHRVGGQGHDFAPSLSGNGARAKPAEILESILHPSKKITEGFAITQLVTNDGKVVAGVVRHESPTAIQLFQADGRLIELAKRDVEERVLSKTSIMPNNFGLMLAPQEIADVAVWLAQQQRGVGFQPQRGGETPPPPADGKFAVDLKTDRVTITHAGRPVADYVFSDPKILRPYFANVHGPSGVKITRNHPPVQGKDATDHATMHPGIWFGFGDISGVDFWRNKGRIEHVRFVSAPNVTKDGVTFATEGRLLLPDGKPLATLTSRCAISARPAGWLLIWDATFHADQRDVTFGDQEEMGFGARVATALTEKSGGTILNNNGKKTAKATWGQPAAWCDYSGMKHGRQTGILLMASPKNFRTPWWHNRDYGVFVANPFGREAMKQVAKSAVTVKKGESLRLVFGAMLHDANDFDPATEYRHFVKAIR
jgi:putative heme-binding domain-containing protein